MARATAPRTTRNAIPRPVCQALARIDRRLRGASMLNGAGRAAMVAALAAAAGMTADVAWDLPRPLRWTIWTLWVVAAAALFLKGLLRAVARPKPERSLALAAIAERAFPRVGERLTGLIGLLGHQGHSPRSATLIEALANDASAHVALFDAAAAVALPVQKAMRWFAGGLLAVAAVAGPALVRPDPFATLAKRFLMPWGSLERVGRHAIAVRPGDAVVALGDDFSVTAQVTPRLGFHPPDPADVRLEWVEASTGRTRLVAMRASEYDPFAHSFKAVLPRLSSSLTYRVVIDRSSSSRRFRVEAVTPPSVRALSAQVEPPAYTKLPASSARDPSRIEAWEGSCVTLALTASAPLRSAEVTWPTEKGSVRFPMSEKPSEPFSVTVLLAADVSGDYAVSLTDTHGLVSRSEPRRRVVVRPDAPPVLSVTGMEGLSESRPDDTLRLEIDARDDVAVARAELHYAIERASEAPAQESEPGQTVANVDGLGTPRARGEAVLSLKTLNLKPGDLLTYRVRVADNRPAPRGPNVAWSGPMRLTLVEKAEPLGTRRNRAERAQVQAKLDALKQAAAENRRETEPLRYAADAVQRGNGIWDEDRRQALARREAAASDLIDRLQVFARDLDVDPVFRPLAHPARQAAEVEAESARATLDQARNASDDAKRLDTLRQADARLTAVSTRLDELQRDLDALGRRDLDRQKLQLLADQQNRVAERAEMAGAAVPDRARLDQLRAEQNAVRNGLDALLKASPNLRAEVVAEQADEADALAKRARDLAERQRLEARQATDLSRKEKADALKRLADDQRALESDARRLALDVDLPLAENGRGRLNIESIRRAPEPIERGEVIEGRQRLQEAENELRRLAHDLEDAPGDLKAVARRLAQRQEQIASAVVQALGELRSKPAVPADEQAALWERLRPLVARQEAVAKRATALAQSREAKEGDQAEPRFPRDAAEKAGMATAGAAKTLRKAEDPRAVEARGNEARDALQKLANDLPDPRQRGEPARKALDEARRVHAEVVRDIEKHLRETDNPKDPARGLADLANRVTPLAGRAAEAEAKLGAVKPAPRAKPQRDRATRRARTLGEAIEAARAQGAKSAGFEPEKVKATRDALAAAVIEARVTFERLEQSMSGQLPADDLAAEIADDQRALSAKPPTGTPLERAARLDDQRRLASALRSVRAPDARNELEAALRQADAAARVLAEPQASPDKDGAAVGRAAEAAEALARRLADERPAVHPERAADALGDPDLQIRPKHAARARELAVRERRLRERLQAVLGDHIAPQEELRRESLAIGRELGDLRDRAQSVSDRSREPADEAARQLGEHAPRAMEESVAKLAQGEPVPAREAQRRAAESAERGAQSADDLAVALRAEKAGAAGAESKHVAGNDPRALSAARQAMAQASGRLDAAHTRDSDAASDPSPAMQAARQAMRAAADRLRDAAEAGSPGQGRPSVARSEPGATPGSDPVGGRAGVASPAELPTLQKLVREKTGRAWGELPGHLRTEILQMSQGRYRDDYARLIQLYFREIAAAGEKK